MQLPQSKLTILFLHEGLQHQLKHRSLTSACAYDDAALCMQLDHPPTVLTRYEQRAFVHPCHHSDSCAPKHWHTVQLISIPVSAPEAVCQPLCCALAAIFASAGPAVAPLLPEARAPQMSSAPEWQSCTP